MIQAEILTIGDELLIGQVVDTNATWLAGRLTSMGIAVYQINTVGDSPQQLQQALTAIAGRSQLVLMTGGLGPTKDDRTKKVLADYFGMPLKQDQAVLENVRKVIARKLGEMNSYNTSQAMVPEGCRVIQNPVGTAPVLWFEHEGTVFVSMPGVPFEMKQLMREKIIPALQARFQTPVLVYKTVLTTGLPEAMLAEVIQGWEEQLPNTLSLAYLPSPGRIRLRLSATGTDEKALHKLLDSEIAKLWAYIPDNIFGYDDATLGSVVGDILRKQGASLALAESCTGGAIAAQITEHAGASEFFKGGFVSYSNASKMKHLGVPSATLARHGAVSEATVRAMATGARQAMAADYSLAISGIAGPGGGTKEKPVGTVWVGVAGPGRTFARQFAFGDVRKRNITRASAAALNLLRLELIRQGKEG